MITFTAASPAAINSPNWAACQNLKLSFSSGFPRQSTSLSRNLFPCTSNIYQSRKGLFFTCQASSRSPDRLLVQPGTTEIGELERVRETDPSTVELKSLKLLESDKSIFEDVLTFESSISKDVRTANSRASPRPKESIKEKNHKRLNSSASQISSLSHHQVFKYPILTERAMKEMIEHNTLVFAVDKRADKNVIKAAAKEMLKAVAKSVNTLIMPDGTKKAYVTLVPECKAVDIAKKIKIL